MERKDYPSWNAYRRRKPMGKLTPHQRHEIGNRLAEGEDPNDLADEYGVSRRTILTYRR